MSTQTNLTLAQETIAFQPKAFGLELEAVIEEILQSSLSAKAIDNKYSAVLAKVIDKYTNLKIKVQFDTDLEPVSLPFVPMNGLVLSSGEKARHDDKTATSIVNYIKEAKLTNTVNIKTARVSGIFSEVTTPILFSLDIIKNRRLDKGEVVAVLMHEIGHVFTYYEYQNRFVTSNQVLASLLKSVENDPVETYTYVYKTAAEVLTGSKNGLDSLQEVKDKNLITAIVIDKTMEGFVSQTNSPYNDSVAVEQLADAFAARMGYARALITAMEKMYTSIELDKRGKARSSMFAVEIAGLLTQLVLVGFLSVVSSFVAASLAALYITAIFKISSKIGANSRDSYDDTRVRYLRIKEQVVEQIKDRKLPANEIKKLVEDLDRIDAVVDEYAEAPYQSLVVQAINYVFRKHRVANDTIKLQRTLEELASNDLFVRAAQLSTLRMKKANHA